MILMKNNTELFIGGQFSTPQNAVCRFDRVGNLIPMNGTISNSSTVVVFSFASNGSNLFAGLFVFFYISLISIISYP